MSYADFTKGYVFYGVLEEAPSFIAELNSTRDQFRGIGLKILEEHVWHEKGIAGFKWRVMGDES